MVTIEERFGNQEVEQFERGEKWIKVRKNKEDRGESFAVDGDGTIWQMRFDGHLTENDEPAIGWIASRASYNQIEQTLDECDESKIIDPEHPELPDYFNKQI